MEHLTKQQIVLLTLLVSFVTALATGVVTVSLMNQAPASVGQTISRVIERTIDATSPQGAAVGSLILFEDQIANAVDRVSSSTVQIKSGETGNIIGIGLIVSKDAVVVTDKRATDQASEYIIILADGKQIPVVIIQKQINGDIVFLAPVISDNSAIKSAVPITFSKIPKLGQTILSLYDSSKSALAQGIVTEITYENKIINSSVISTTPAPIIHTSLPVSRVMPGSPLFDVDGEVVGVNLSSLNLEDEASFYSVSALKDVIPVIQK